MSSDYSNLPIQALYFRIDATDWHLDLPVTPIVLSPAKGKLRWSEQCPIERDTSQIPNAVRLDTFTFSLLDILLQPWNVGIVSASVFSESIFKLVRSRVYSELPSLYPTKLTGWAIDDVSIGKVEFL